MKARAVCTAILTAGARTQRVDRVIRATPEARSLIARAEVIRKERRAEERPGRLGLCEPHPNSASRPFRVIAVSIYCDELQRLDDLVAKRKRGGQSTSSRSKLIRVAVKQLLEHEP